MPAVSDNYFGVLGVRPFMGRLFEPASGSHRSDGPTVVLGHDFWKEALDGDADVIGTPLTV